MPREIPLTIRLRDKDIRRADLDEALRIDRHSLEKELSRQPGTYAFWCSMYTESMYHLDNLRDRLERLEARLFEKFLHQHKKPTEIKLLVRIDDDYRSMQKNIREWEKTVNFLKHAERAFSQRKDMLQMLAAGERRERKHS